MKKTLFFLFLSLAAGQSFGQKFGYIDTEYISSKMPEYQEAMTSLNTYSEQWVKDIQNKYAELEDLRLTYQKEEILLTEEMKKKRQSELEAKEREVKELNNAIFGMNGQLFQKKKRNFKTCYGCDL